jgi:pyridoxamine 5'-phosphate oxidase
MARKPQKKTDEQFYAEAAREPPLPDSADPLVLFETWFADAQKAEPNDPNSMALATADADGLPNVRMVLLKGVDRRGFVFYTNTESAKGRELAANAKAALLFHWKSLRRQVRVQGPVEPVTVEEADAYFATRPRGSQIGAWASDQSRAMPDRLALERRVAEYGLKFGLGKVERPPHWSGYRVLPLAIEFWRDRPFRLHERLAYSRPAFDQPWSVARLYP